MAADDAQGSESQLRVLSNLVFYIRRAVVHLDALKDSACVALHHRLSTGTGRPRAASGVRLQRL